MFDSRAVRNLIRRLTGKPVELSPKQEERMAKMRARADAQIAKGESEARAGMAEAARVTAAATSVSGATAPPPMPTEIPTSLPSVREMVSGAIEDFREVFGEMSDDRSGVIDPGPGADFHRPPKELEDPSERERLAAAERADRNAARAPYRAPEAPEVAFTRIATIGLSAHPEAGVRRLPDSRSHGRRARERGADLRGVGDRSPSRRFASVR